MGLTARTVNVNVPAWLGVPARIAPCVPLLASDRPGGSEPETTVKVLTAPLLVSMNAS